MRFIQIPRNFLDLKTKTKFIDVLVFAAIALHTNGKTYKARIGMRTISEKYNITLVKVEESIKRLKANEFLDYTKIKSDNNDYVFNEYTLPKNKDFLMLNPDLLLQDLKAKEKGILIYLQLIAEIGINDIAETTIEGIANRLGITRQTTSKYLKYFVDNGQITKGRFYYKCHYLANTKEKEKTKEMNMTIII